MSNKIGFIGCGNMGGALITAVAKTIPAQNIFVCDLDREKTAFFEKTLGVRATDLATLADECEYIVLGVKPQAMKATLSSMRLFLHGRNNVTLISMAAGLSTAAIAEMLDFPLPIIRIMPNTPASVGEGMLLYSCASVTEDAEKFFLNAFSAVGKLDKLDEKLIDAASALSGCGPAFVCLFAEALADGGVLCGLPRDKANLYAAQTLLGTAKLLLESGKHPGTLKDAVCSPGGTTIEGVRALEEGALRGTVMDAVCAAYEKTVALGKK